MVSHTRNTLSLAFLVLLLGCSLAAPKGKILEDIMETEQSLEQFLNAYYDKYIKKQVEEDVKELKAADKGVQSEDDPYETMQGDQPVTENNIGLISRQYGVNSTNLPEAYNRPNMSEYLQLSRNRSKENFLEFLKKNIIEHIGRGNGSIPRPDEVKSLSMNMSEIIPKFLNTTNLISDDQIMEKIRSFYPSCDVPSNTDEDAWKKDDMMNLFFNFDHVSDERNVNIATATLRLYRLPANGTNIDLDGSEADCDNPSTEEEKLLRVSIYWYTKTLRKKRVKKRLSDSKVISEHSKWVELSVKPATKAWIRGRNLGLGVLVEDQDGNQLRADKYFKGATCMVGMSTPKPIPTIIKDAARKSNEHNGNRELLGRNANSSLHNDIQLLPTVDICTLEFPENYTQPAHIMNLRINACNLRKMHEQSQRLEEKEQLERLATLPELLASPPRHIRHQRQYLTGKRDDGDGFSRDFDPRSRIVGAKVLFTHEQWQNYTNSNKKFDFSTVNR